ncbi:MAG TPA: AsmA family protein [Vitreimonas sp.]|uniref:AsmA family protein n=1 Tax=Vitreimonas sp. TaxID=3069702 RepID=UPI002D4F9700|nr:AsmA family protein [Vitreimonas sp.]HYD86755.1 AsmA family protein [Vitreimonas sp.]
MKPWLRWVLLVGGALLAAALIGAGVLAWLVLRLDVRGEVERAVEAGTGRDAVISGDVGVSYWPVLGLRAHDVTLANVPGGRAASFITAGEIDIGVEIRPLFDRRVVVRRLVLQRPQIALEVDQQGRPNWALQARRPEGQPAPQPSEPAVDVARTRLREVRISNGEVSFFDARTASGWVIGDVDLRTGFDGLDQPMRVQGGLRYADKPIRLDLTLGRPGAAMRGELTPLSLSIETELLEAEFQGQTIAGSGEIAGNVRASGPSLRQLAAWMGSPIQGGVGFEQFAVSGRLQIGGGAYTFSNAGFVLDLVRGRGDFVLSERQNRPYLSGRLELFDFDLNPYLTGVAPAQAPAAQIAAAAEAPGERTLTAEAATAPEAPRAVDVRVAASDTPIDFSGLKAFDADLELATHAVLVQRTQIDSAHANLVLNNGYLAATLHNIALYGGSGRGRFEIDAREEQTRIVQDMAFSGLDARRFLTDTVNYGNIEGRAELSLNIRTVGRTQSDFIEALDGRTHVEVVSGTLHGVDLGGVSTTIRNALRGELIAPEARTPFQGFSATFAISNGVLATDDLSFNTTDLRIPGIGLIDVPNRRLDMRLAPRSPRGGVVVPFSVRGPFGRFEYASDIRDRAQREILGRVRAVEAARSGD